eukprot:TRINITY_DN2145_c0_g1_i4.p2 TRINITY_DN2145_c0_g1~~TRINITY_DN2145_c0_g1_i4.p2  ORF type:complete len:130 (-),score=33.93 TRINITY_DN2145_c0_g1_i4:272-661(-)
MPKRKPVTSPTDSSTANRSVPRSRAAKSIEKSVEVSINKREEMQENALPEEIGRAESRVDLAQVAGNIPAENLRQLAAAVQSGRWLFAAWHVADGRLHLERTAANFPTVDLEKAISMLAENLKELSEAS